MQFLHLNAATMVGCFLSTNCKLQNANCKPQTAGNAIPWNLIQNTLPSWVGKHVFSWVTGCPETMCPRTNVLGPLVLEINRPGILTNRWKYRTSSNVVSLYTFYWPWSFEYSVPLKHNISVLIHLLLFVYQFTVYVPLRNVPKRCVPIRMLGTPSLYINHPLWRK
jgi:hypothetical protein